MFSTIKHLFVGSKLAKLALASVTVVVLGAPAATLAAGHDDRAGYRDTRHDDRGRIDRDRYDRHDNDRGPRIGIDVHLGDRGWRPGYEREQVWVSPVYRTVVDRRWVEPVYSVVAEQVWVPDLFEDRTVRYQDRGRWCERVDHVLVAPGHYETRERRTCLSEGHWDTFERQELVQAGHFEYRG